MALLLTVWLLTLLAVIAGEFMASVRVKAQADHNKKDDLLGLSLALAGYQAAKAFLGDEDLEQLSLDEDDHLQLHYKGVTDPVPANMTDVPLGGGSYSWKISAEDGLVNINDAQSRQIASLLQQCGVGLGVERDTVIDSILDWRDKNREHHLNGAEEDYYRALDPPYSCKDGRFDVVEELLLVKGLRENPRLFHGGEVDGEARPGLRDLVTTYTEDNRKPNPSTAPQEVREALGLPPPKEAPPPEPSYYEIVATGKPAGSTVSRSLRAVVRREAGAGGGFDFTLVYYNDTYIPE